MRIDKRLNNQLRPIKITTGYLDHAAGSVLIEAGKTRVLCAVTIQPGVPRWLEHQNQGWLTAEYAMLPASTHTRSQRETTPSARSQEIRRLIGRSLRAAIDLGHIGENTLAIDCDVIQADGGTRTMAITGAYVALALAMKKMVAEKIASPRALKSNIAAVSVGIVNGEEMLDLCYTEDSHAQVDFNVVMTREGKFIEVQGTAEGEPFERAAMDRLVNLARDGIAELMKIQSAAISGQ